jgi:hypothetical protein
MSQQEMQFEQHNIGVERNLYEAGYERSNSPSGVIASSGHQKITDQESGSAAIIKQRVRLALMTLFFLMFITVITMWFISFGGFLHEPNGGFIIIFILIALAMFYIAAIALNMLIGRKHK